MDPRHLFMDQRLTAGCAYCGGPADTQDHVPSRILLDDPLPPELPVVKACAACNQGFSLDEEYLACLIDCALSGTAAPDGPHRDKVRRALCRNQPLAARLQNCMRTGVDGTLLWQAEMHRVRNVVVKLARGHAAYELYPQIDEPSELRILPYLAMSDQQTKAFEQLTAPGELQLWPEIGSRAFMRACGLPPDPHQVGEWIIVQPDRYRYSVEETGGVLVQLVLSEYLACWVSWE